MREDRVGLGWRPELAAGILTHLHRIDVVEVVADDYLAARANEVRSLRTLASAVPLLLHGVGLGLASCAPVSRQRLQAWARLVDRVRPESWSEHLAFVRAGGMEIGHLAAPPRSAAVIEGTAANVEAARRVVGSRPFVENVASLIDPPGSDRTEPAWIAGVLAASGADLLLDLHNLHTNAVNFGFSARDALDELPLDRVGLVHLAGGRWVGQGAGRRWLDDHLHGVPSEVYELLEHVAAHAPVPLTVVLERDGAYPGMAELLTQLEDARAAIRRGRTRGWTQRMPKERRPLPGSASPTGTADLETFLARLYTDEKACARFLSDPAGESSSALLSPADRAALETIDRTGLALAARSFAHKRARSEARTP